MPAANNVLGQPTRGWLSTRGVVPSCRSLDCVSVFARSGRAAEVLAVAGGYDAEDPRRVAAGLAGAAAAASAPLSVPREGDLAFDDVDYESCTPTPVATDEPGGTRRGWTSAAVEAGALLYEGPSWRSGACGERAALSASRRCIRSHARCCAGPSHSAEE